MPEVWGFSVEKTLRCGWGPIREEVLLDLRAEGHVVGIIGNWGKFCRSIRGWQDYVSFLSIGLSKEVWMCHFKEVLPIYDRYVLVGNTHKKAPGTNDDYAVAQKAGWDFINSWDFRDIVPLKRYQAECPPESGRRQDV